MTIKLVLTLELPRSLRWAGRWMIRRIHKWGTLYNPADSDVADMVKRAGRGGAPCTVLSVPTLEADTRSDATSLAGRIRKADENRLLDQLKITWIATYIQANYQDEIKAGEHGNMPHPLDVALHYMKRERRLTEKRHKLGDCECGLYHTNRSLVVGKSFREVLPSNSPMTRLEPTPRKPEGAA